MDKINHASELKVPGSFDTGLHNLSLIKSTTPGQVPTNTAQPSDGRLAVRARSEARTGAATQGRDGNRPSPSPSPSPTASSPPKAKGGTPPSNPFIEPDRRIDASTTSREVLPGQWEIEQTPSAVMARAKPTIELLNSAVKSFYREASGGRAARANGNMTWTLNSIASLKSDLASLVKVSASFVAANSADYPALGKWRQDLIRSVGSIDTWLKSAHAYAAGMTGPGPRAQYTTTPALVRPPSVILSPSVSPRIATREVAEIWQEYKLANKVSTRT